MSLLKRKFFIAVFVSLAPVSTFAQASSGAPQGFEDYRAKSLSRPSAIIQCFSRANDSQALGSCLPNLEKPVGMAFSAFKGVPTEAAIANRDCYLSSATQQELDSCRARKQQLLASQSLSQHPAAPPIRPVASATGNTAVSAVNIVAKAICIYTADQWKASPAPSSPMPADRAFSRKLSGAIFLFEVTNQPEKNGGLISGEFRQSWLAANNGNEQLAKKNLASYYAWSSDAHITDHDSKWQFNQERSAALKQAVFKSCPAPSR